VGGDCGRCMQAGSAYGPVDTLQRAQHADGGNLGIRSYSDADEGIFRSLGSGLMEYDQKTGKWDKYDDPDGGKRDGTVQGPRIDP